MASAQGIKAGKAYVEIGAVATGLNKGLEAAGAKLRAWGMGIAAIGASITAPLLALGAVFASRGKELLELSAGLGLTVEGLSALEYAARKSGASSEDLAGGLTKMNRLIAEASDGTPGAAAKLEHLGITFEELAPLGTIGRMSLFADRIAAIRDPGIQAGRALEIFGKGARPLIPLLRQGAAGIAAFIEQARAKGLIVSTEDAESAKQFTMQMGALAGACKTAAMIIGAGLLPGLSAAFSGDKDLAASIVSVARATGEWLRANAGMIEILFRAGLYATGFGVALYTLGRGVSLLTAGVNIASRVVTFGFGLMSFAVSLFTTAFGLVGTVVSIGSTVIGFAVTAASTAMTTAFAIATGACGFLSGAFGFLVLVGSIAVSVLETIAVGGMALVSGASTILGAVWGFLTGMGAALAGASALVSAGMAATSVSELAATVATWALNAAVTVFEGLTGILLVTLPLAVIGLVLLAAAAIACGFALGAIAAWPVAIVLGSIAAVGVAASHLWHIFTAGADHLGGLGEAFEEFGATAMQTWGGIKDAIAAGDMGLAANVALAGLRVAFFNGVASLKPIFEDFYDFVIDTMQAMATEVVRQFATMLASMVAWANTMGDGFAATMGWTGITAAAASLNETADEMLGNQGANQVARRVARERAGPVARTDDQIIAQIDLDNAIEEANIAAMQARLRNASGSLEEGGEGAEGAAKKFTSQGTFSAAGLAGFATAVGDSALDVAQRSLTVQERIAAAGEVVAAAARAGGGLILG